MDNPLPDAPFGADPVADGPADAVDDDAPGALPDRGSAAAATGHEDEHGYRPAAAGRPTPGEAVSAGKEPDGVVSSASAIPPGGDVAASAPAHSSTSLFGYLALYTLLRVALVVALTAVLMIFMPLIVALLFAIIVQLPLSWLLFAGPRRRVNESMARAAQVRRDERARLQSALHGDESRD